MVNKISSELIEKSNQGDIPAMSPRDQGNALIALLSSLVEQQRQSLELPVIDKKGAVTSLHIDVLKEVLLAAIGPVLDFLKNKDIENVSVYDSALPEGAATEASQKDIVKSLEGLVKSLVSGLSINSSNLPRGAATEETLSKLLSGCSSKKEVEVVNSELPKGAATEETLINVGKLLLELVKGISVKGNVSVEGVAKDSTLEKVIDAVNKSGKSEISISSSALPRGAATDSKLEEVLSSLERLGQSLSSSGIVSVKDALPEGKNTIGKLAENSGVIVGKVELEDKVISILQSLYTKFASDANSVNVSVSPWKLFRLISNQSINSNIIKNTPAVLGGFTVSNRHKEYTSYLKIYDKEVEATVGVDSPKFTIEIPPSSGPVTVSDSAGFNFEKGMSIALTLGAEDNDIRAVSANDVLLTLWYK